MTQNQIAYQRHLEDVRSHGVQERETAQHNRETEAQGRAKLKLEEQLGWANVGLGYANVNLGYSQLAEQNRANIARETETNRSNLAKEFEMNRTNEARERETHRANRVNETLGLVARDQEKQRLELNENQLKEAERHNREMERIQRMSGTYRATSDIASALYKMEGIVNG